jgi:hypothetical protein
MTADSHSMIRARLIDHLQRNAVAGTRHYRGAVAVEGTCKSIAAELHEEPGRLKAALYSLQKLGLVSFHERGEDLVRIRVRETIVNGDLPPHVQQAIEQNDENLLRESGVVTQRTLSPIARSAAVNNVVRPMPAQPRGHAMMDRTDPRSHGTVAEVVEQVSPRKEEDPFPMNTALQAERDRVRAAPRMTAEELSEPQRFGYSADKARVLASVERIVMDPLPADREAIGSAFASRDVARDMDRERMAREERERYERIEADRQARKAARQQVLDRVIASTPAIVEHHESGIVEHHWPGSSEVEALPDLDPILSDLLARESKRQKVVEAAAALEAAGLDDDALTVLGRIPDDSPLEGAIIQHLKRQGY